jgi:hypothetical protein
MTETVTLAGDDALFIADVLHLASRLLKSGHSAELGPLAAGLARAAAVGSRRGAPGLAPTTNLKKAH